MGLLFPTGTRRGPVCFARLKNRTVTSCRRIKYIEMAAEWNQKNVADIAHEASPSACRVQANDAIPQRDVSKHHEISIRIIDLQWTDCERLFPSNGDRTDPPTRMTCQSCTIISHECRPQIEWRLAQWNCGPQTRAQPRCPLLHLHDVQFASTGCTRQSLPSVAVAGAQW
jgi:hypothetical protein